MLAAATVIGCSAIKPTGNASAAAPIDYSLYKNGVTVVANSDSPTGYYAVFVFDGSSVDATKYGLKDISKVQVYSDGMYLFSYDEQAAGTALDPNRYAHTPFEFKSGMYPAGGDTTGTLYGGKKIAYYIYMEKFAAGKWGVAIPLTSGATYYNYRLTDSAGTSDTSYIDDPANPAMVDTASGVKTRSSMVYVPYNSTKAGTDAWADRTVENPRTDGKKGTVTFTSYTGAAGDTRYLGVYLPYGYDKSRSEKYNVLYLSHGAQSEKSGCELRWLNECDAANIMDNLEGNFIIVTMNNTDLGWDIDKIWAEQQIIMPLIEKNYNAGSDPANRAFAGLSMGGFTASHIYAQHADQFGYFGFWSGALSSYVTGLTDDQKKTLAAQKCKISIGAGDWDYVLPSVKDFAGTLDKLGVSYNYFTVPGSHDWRTWQAMLSYTVKNFFWKTAPANTPADTAASVNTSVSAAATSVSISSPKTGEASQPGLPVLAVVSAAALAAAFIFRKRSAYSAR